MSKKLSTLITLILLLVFSTVARSESFHSSAISKRYSDVAMTPGEVKFAKMQGECLVGLKELNFKKKENFDAIAEWTNYRTISLLEQFPPCDVLVMMDVAQKKLREAE